MTRWPQDYLGAWTLAREVERRGIGLHSGAVSTVRLCPCDQPGFYLRLEGSAESVLLSPDQVRDSQLCTTLDLGTIGWPPLSTC